MLKSFKSRCEDALKRLRLRPDVRSLRITSYSEVGWAEAKANILYICIYLYILKQPGFPGFMR